MREQEGLAVDAADDVRDVETAAQGTTDDRVRRLGGWVLLGAAVTASALVVSHDDLTVDWFSDEMWRVAMVHSPEWWDLYLGWDTPTPPGFLLFFRGVDVFLPTGPLGLRLWVLAGLVAAMLITARLLLAIVARPPLPVPWRATSNAGEADDDARSTARMRSMRIAAIATVVILPLLEAFGVHRIFVQYVFEVTLAAAILLAVERLDHGARWWPVLLATIVVAPIFTIGTVFLLPAAVLYAAWWAWRQDDRRRRLIQAGGAVAASVAAGLTVWVVAYRPVAGESITSYWRPWSLDGDASQFPRLLGDSLRQLRLGVLAWSQPDAIFDMTLLVSILLMVCAVVGLVSLGRRWPPLLVFLVTGWVGVVAASYLQAWPMTPERVNLAVFFPLYAATVFGAVRSVSVIARESAAVTIGACLAIGLLSWPSYETELFGNAFLRGLTSDLEVVAASPSSENWVVTYHFASQWYAEDALVTSPPGDRTYELFTETYTDFRMYDPAVLAERVDTLAPGTAVWCVIPYDIGPGATEEACQVPDDLTQFYDGFLERSGVRGFIVGCADLWTEGDGEGSGVPDEVLRACDGSFVFDPTAGPGEPADAAGEELQRLAADPGHDGPE